MCRDQNPVPVVAQSSHFLSCRVLYQIHPHWGVVRVRRRRPPGSLRCGKLSARSRRSGLRSRAEDNIPSLACHASAHITGCVHSASYACKSSRPHSRHAGPCGCYAVRASRSANPTPSARVHLPPLRSHHTSPNPKRLSLSVSATGYKTCAA